ncbi:MAG: DUF3168 domain-containing protein [Pseudomonadota bacterium]
MTHSAISLQEAIHAALLASAGLIESLNGPHVYDDVPMTRKPPYVVFAEARHLDWSTSGEAGNEHLVTLQVWSRKRGRREVLEISDHILEALAQVPDQIGDHALVNLRHEFTDVEQDEASGLFVASINLRVVTEPSSN